VSHDAAFAAAWAKEAEAHHLLVMMGAVPPRDAYPAAARAAAHALAAQPELPGAHLAQGLVDLWFNWRPEAAARSFERALALNPSDAASHHDYAWSLVALGRVDDAIRHITRARDLDPLSTRANNDIGWLYLHVRRPAEAARACEHTLALDMRSLEAQACLERAYAGRELFDAALDAARATLRDPERASLPADGTAENQLRQIWAWRRDQIARATQTRWINPYTLAVHHALTGQREQALDALDAAFAARVGMLVFLARDPVMDPLRGEPRFEALLRKITAPSS
jgi:tetratricopeptide (TPR) repeat protein